MCIYYLYVWYIHYGTTIKNKIKFESVVHTYDTTQSSFIVIFKMWSSRYDCWLSQSCIKVYKRSKKICTSTRHTASFTVRFAQIHHSSRSVSCIINSRHNRKNRYHIITRPVQPTIDCFDHHQNYYENKQRPKDTIICRVHTHRPLQNNTHI